MCDRAARNTVLALLDWANRLMSVKTGERYVRERNESYQIRDRDGRRIRRGDCHKVEVVQHERRV